MYVPMAGNRGALFNTEAGHCRLDWPVVKRSSELHERSHRYLAAAAAGRAVRPGHQPGCRGAGRAVAGDAMRRRRTGASACVPARGGRPAPRPHVRAPCERVLQDLHCGHRGARRQRRRDRVGPYVLREELGRGGMGVVFRAERVDGQVRQEVALKIVRRCARCERARTLPAGTRDRCRVPASVHRTHARCRTDAPMARRIWRWS